MLIRISKNNVPGSISDVVYINADDVVSLDIECAHSRVDNICNVNVAMRDGSKKVVQEVPLGDANALVKQINAMSMHTAMYDLNSAICGLTDDNRKLVEDSVKKIIKAFVPPCEKAKTK